MDEQETGAPDSGNIQQVLVEGIKQERMVQNDVVYSEQRMSDQRKQLDELLNYRNECASGLRSAGNGLSVAQLRDYELLVRHLDNVVQVQQQRLTARQHEFEQYSTRLREVQLRNQETDLLIKASQKQHDELHKHETEPDNALQYERKAWKSGVPAQNSEDHEPGKRVKPSYR